MQFFSPFFLLLTTFDLVFKLGAVTVLQSTAINVEGVEEKAKVYDCKNLGLNVVKFDSKNFRFFCFVSFPLFFMISPLSDTA